MTETAPNLDDLLTIDCDEVGEELRQVGKVVSPLQQTHQLHCQSEVNTFSSITSPKTASFYPN